MQDVLQSRDISTLVVLHHLRDLAEVLDNLTLYDECRLTGNCAIDLAEALGRRSLEFRQEQAETLAIIAGLSVYELRARTLFIQAVSICEEVVANNASHSNKYRLLCVLETASYFTSDYLGAQWLECAVRLIAKELPPTMVHPYSRSTIYHNYGNRLLRLKQYANASEAYRESISFCRILVNNNPTKYNYRLARTLVNMGVTLHDLGKYDDAIVANKEVLDICTAMSAQDPLQYNELMGHALNNYGVTLKILNHISEAAAVQKQALPFYRNLAETKHEWTQRLCGALHNYGESCYSLGEHTEAVIAYQESIQLQRARAAIDPEQEPPLRVALHNIANSFNALGNYVEGNAAAIEALERNHGRVFERCNDAPDFKSCFVCQRATIPDSLSNPSASLPVLPANSSSQPAEHPRADTSLAPTETPKTVKVSVRRRRDTVLGLFRGNRGQ